MKDLLSFSLLAFHPETIVFNELSCKVEEKHFAVSLVTSRKHELRTPHRIRLHKLYKRKLLLHKFELSCITIHMSTADCITIGTYLIFLLF